MVAGSPFDPEVTPWCAWSPARVAEEMSRIRVDGRAVRWAVAGGWAIDLHLGRITRVHGDLEIAVPEAEASVVLGAYRVPGWRWDVPLDGRLYRRDSAAFGLTRQTWLWSEAERGFVMEVFRESAAEGIWVFRRDARVRRAWAEVVCVDPVGVPYLAPEVVLLFKARHLRAKDVADLEVVLPVLGAGRRAWLRGALEVAHPGHEWLGVL